MYSVGLILSQLKPILMGRSNFKDISAGLWKTLRPHQWVKNVFVLAPLFFSKTFFDEWRVFAGCASLLLFCFASGTVYLINDIADIEEDKRHPQKKHRPIPSGQLPVSIAKYLAWGLGILTLCGAVLLSPMLAVILASYIVLNIAYSLSLKEFAFLDVSIIAFGFVLRILAGAYAIDVSISEWLFACTFSVSLYLGLGKRAHELSLYLAEDEKSTRAVLETYQKSPLNFAVLYVAGLTIALYTIYTLTAALPSQPLRSQTTPFATPWLPITIPFVIFGIIRFYQIIQNDSPESPTNLMLQDTPFLINLGGWSTVIGILAI